MKYKVMAITALIVSVISLACAITSERRAQAAAERAFAKRTVELERRITDEIAAKLMPTNAPVV